MHRGSTGELAVASPRAAEPAAKAFDLFVVHAAADADFVRGYLLPALNLPSSRVLLVDELTPGAAIVAEIDHGVSRSCFTVAVLSPAYFEDRWAVFGEQLASYASVEDTHVIPLRLIDCQLPLHLEARVALDFTDRARWEDQAARLRTLLHTTAPAAEQITCPYPGMRPFAAHEASRFFGRDKEIDDLIGRLDRDEREIYVIGPSGSGKSSLVQAGLLHRLNAGASRLERSFLVRAMRPGERPGDRLAQTLEGELETPAATVAALVARHPPAERVLVVVDQLEELFTLADAAERQRFTAMLRLLRTETRCYLLLALRADFYGALLDSELWPGLAGRISPLAVVPLRGPALAQAITAPALRVGVHLEPRLCDRLVTDAAAEPGALPLVQETLRLLWDKRRLRLLGLAEYEALGDGGRGLDVAIAWRAGTTLNALTVAQQTIARRMLLRLVIFGEGRADTRGNRRSRRCGPPRTTRPSGAASLLDPVELSEAVQWMQSDAARELGYRAELPELVAASRSEIEKVERQRRRRSAVLAVFTAVALLLALVAWIQRQKAHRLLGTNYLEQGRALLLNGHPMQALPYLVAARTEGIESSELRMLFAQASRDLPSVTLVTMVNHSLSPEEAFSADGKRVVTRRGKAARVWDATTGKPVTLPLEHQGVVNAVAFSPDGTRVVTASNDSTARVWDASTGKPVAPPLEHQDAMRTAAFSPDGTRVVTASDDKTAKVWNASTGTPMLPPLEHSRPVTTGRFSPDGSRVITINRDDIAAIDMGLRVWDAAMSKSAFSLKQHGPVNVATFSADGTRVVTAGQDNTARIWDASAGTPVTPPLEHQGKVNAAAFSSDSTRVVTGSWDNTARVWNAWTGKPVTPPLQHQRIVVAAAFSPDGTRVATASFDRTARIWDVTTGRPITPPLEHQGAVDTVAFSSDGTRVVTASRDNTARVWDAATGKPRSPPLEHQGAIHAAAFSPDGTRVVTASLDHTARVWDATTGEPVTSPLEHQGDVNAAAFSPDGTRVVTASDDRTARVWILPDMGSLDDWRLLARCAPFVFADGALTTNDDPLRVCPPH